MYKRQDEYIPDALVVDLLPGGVEIENLALGGNDAFVALLRAANAIDEHLDWSFGKGHVVLALSLIHI